MANERNPGNDIERDTDEEIVGRSDDDDEEFDDIEDEDEDEDLEESD